jgi:hypothetical protein
MIKIKWYLNTTADINGKYITLTQRDKDENKPEKKDLILLPLNKLKDLIERAEQSQDGHAEYNINKSIDTEQEPEIKEVLK